MSHSLRLVLAANVVVLAIFLWAQLERQTIEVVVSPTAVEAYGPPDGKLLASAPGGAGGEVGVYLSLNQLPGRAPTLPDPPAVLTWLGRESAWESITVYRASDHAVVLYEDFAGGLNLLLPGQVVGQVDTVGAPAADDYVVEATLLRAREQVGIEVFASPEGGRIFLFRPEHRDGGWYSLLSSGITTPIAAIPYRAYAKSLLSITQDVIRLLLGAYPAALAVALVLGAVGALGGAIPRRPRKPAVEEGAKDVGEPGADRDQGDGPSTSPLTRRPRSRARRLAPTIAALIFALAGLSLGAFVATYHLERIPHVQDSVAYLFQAKVFALGRLWAPVPQLQQFFTHEFVVMYDGKWFAKYPPGHPLLLALAVLAGAPWLVSPIAAGLSVFLIYLIGRRVYGWPTALLAAGLALVSPFFIFLSGSFMAHSTGLLFVLLFVWLFLGRERAVAAALAGAALGFAFLIRPWTAGVIAAPFAVVALADFARAPRQRLSRYVAMAGAFVPFVLVWLGYNWALTGSTLKNTMELWWTFDKVGFGPDHGPFGFWPADGLYNTSRNLTELQAHLFGWPPYLTFVFITLPFIVGRARRQDWLFLAAFLSLVAGYSLWWADGIMFGPRFYYEALGFLLLLTARGIVEVAHLARRAADRWSARGGTSRTIGAAFAGVLLVLLVGYNFAYYLPYQWQLYRGYNYVNAGPIDAVQKAGLHNALVFAYVGEWYEWWNYGMVFSSNSPLLDGDVVYARDLGNAEDQRLMAQYPGRSYYRLKGTTLTPLPGPGE